MTPVISEDGEITLGIKKTSAFVVDAKTGRVVHTYRLDSAPPLLGVQEAKENPLLLAEDAKELVEASSSSLGMPRHLIYVTRTDYMLQHYSPNSTKILWNVTFADIEAEFRCQGLGGSLGGIFTNAKKDIDEFEWKLPCQMKTPVVRIRDRSLLEFNKPVITWLTDRANFLPTPDHPLVLEPDKRFMLALPTDGERPMLALPASEAKHPEILDGNADASNNKSSLFKFVMASPLAYVCAAILSTLGFVSCNYMPLRKQDKLNKPVEGFKVHTGAAKKKRSRRSGSNRNSPYDDRKQKYLSLGGKVEDTKGLPQIEQIDKISGAITDIGDGNVHGYRIGKLHISKTEIAKGSNGTVVLEGIYDGRPVAVKRLVQTHHDVALKEIENLIASDQHPNIVRWYGVEFDRDFVYLALERCTSNLSDLIYVYSECYQNQSHYLPGHEKKFKLWKANGYPSVPLLKLMRDVVLGLAHLHELGIIHRDLKPQNVLIINEKPFCAKLSDMGISKRLLGDSTSLTQNTTGYGSSGWQAPEQLQHGRQTRAVDLFSLGCLLFFCVTGGKHPFGESIERDVNIVNDRKDLFLVEHIPEAVNLLSLLLDHNPNNRPKAQQVLSHPLFWTSEKRLSFLQDVSDRVELEDREGESEVLNALETISTVTLGGKWDEKMETIFINNIGRYRRYKFDSVRDLLRVIRNKSHHYRELPEEIKELLGSHPVGFESYFSSRFPKLLIEVYKVICQHCREEEFFHKYTDSTTF
ncbi:hypothetical protein K2173_027954 [Erythroxylum novogranatense]|uniref:non-specific serine/threonine protein kinase n=1 Tax=Erythroxylum novogranatense TaxID=1862640 RepID=A0AAV8U0E9_9ROSI|nr:hypothetical protein K2173_027954 [Erythroxylum novogranatense]